MRCELVALALVLAGCPSPRERESLVDHSLWSELEAGEDPFDDRPDTVTCPTSGWGLEVDPTPGLEVDTGACDYLSAAQPTLVDVRAGETIRIQISHGALVFGGPAEAHAALQIDGALLLDERVTIPADADSLEVLSQADASIAAGARVVVHLHNHGDNAWLISEVSTGPPAPE